MTNNEHANSDTTAEKISDNISRLDAVTLSQGRYALKDGKLGVDLDEAVSTPDNSVVLSADSFENGIDHETTSPKAQTIIELIATGKDGMANQILEEDHPEKFTYRDISDLAEAIEDRHEAGKPVNYFLELRNLARWGVPMLDLDESDGFVRGTDEEHFTDLLNSAIGMTSSRLNGGLQKNKALASRITNGQVFTEEDDIADVYALGWTYDDSIRDTNIEIMGSYRDKDEPTVAEVNGDNIIIHNAMVNIRYGYTDSYGPYTRASYTVDLALQKNGRILISGEPSYMEGFGGNVVIKDTQSIEE